MPALVNTTMEEVIDTQSQDPDTPKGHNEAYELIGTVSGHDYVH